MSSTIILPPNSFWSVLPQITKSALDSYQNAQDREEQRKARERAEDLQRLGILQNAANSGADVNSEISKIWQRVGITGTPTDTPAQDRIKLEKMPEKSTSFTIPTIPGVIGGKVDVGGRDKVSDDRLARAGLTTNVQKEEQAFARGSRTYETGKREREIALRPLKEASEVQTYVAQSAPGFVAEWLQRNGGRITPENGEQLIDQAYGTFLERFGSNIPVELQDDGRSAFAAAAYGAYKEQQNQDMERARLDIQKAELGLRRAALANRGSGGVDPETSGRLLDSLTKMGNGLQNDITAIAGAKEKVWMQMLISGQTPPQGEEGAAFAEFADRVQRLEAVRTASARVAAGMTGDKETADLLLGISAPMARTTEPVGGTTITVQRTADGRQIITSDQREFLKARGKWNASKYKVED